MYNLFVKNTNCRVLETIQHEGVLTQSQTAYLLEKYKIYVGYGTVFGSSCAIGENTAIGENCKIENACNIGCSVKIGDNCAIGSLTLICNDSKIFENCSIGFNCEIFRNVKLCENIKLENGFRVESNVDIKTHLHVKGTRHIFCGAGSDVKIGCIQMPLKKWLRELNRIGEENGYTDKQIAEYRIYLNAYKKLLSIE